MSPHLPDIIVGATVSFSPWVVVGASGEAGGDVAYPVHVYRDLSTGTVRNAREYYECSTQIYI